MSPTQATLSGSMSKNIFQYFLASHIKGKYLMQKIFSCSSLILKRYVKVLKVFLKSRFLVFA